MILQEVHDFLDAGLQSAPEVKEIVIGSGFTGVLLSNGDAGISMNIRRGASFWNNDNEDLLKRQIGRKALTVVNEMAAFTDTVLTSIRVALLNALSSPFLNEAHLGPFGHHIRTDEKTSITTSIKPGDTVTLVGFGGMVRDMAKRASKVYVTELDTDFCKSLIVNEQGIETGPTRVEIVHASKAKDVFKISDKIFITGSALVTHTMEEVLEICPPTAEVIIYGHTAAFFPLPFFQRGAHRIETRKVTDAALMMDFLKNYGPMVERFFPWASEEISILSSRPS